MMGSIIGVVLVIVAIVLIEALGRRRRKRARKPGPPVDPVIAAAAASIHASTVSIRRKRGLPPHTLPPGSVPRPGARIGT